MSFFQDPSALADSRLLGTQKPLLRLPARIADLASQLEDMRNKKGFALPRCWLTGCAKSAKLPGMPRKLGLQYPGAIFHWMCRWRLGEAPPCKVLAVGKGKATQMHLRAAGDGVPEVRPSRVL